MSGDAITRITTVLGQVSSAISGLSSQAQSIISKATAALEDDTKFPERGAVVLSAADYKPTYTQSDFVQGMPVIVNPQLPEPPDYNTSGTATGFPDGSNPWQQPLTVGPFQPTPIQPGYEPIVPPPMTASFDEGTIGSDANSFPDPNYDFSSGPPPTLLLINALQSDLTLVLPPINTVPIDVNFNILDYESEIEELTESVYFSTTQVNDELELFQNKIFDELSPGLLDSLNKRMNDPYAIVNPIKDRYMENLFEQRLIEIRDQQVNDRDYLAMGSGWDLPAPIVQAISLQLTQVLNSWIDHAKAQRSTQIIDHAQKITEVCADIYQQLREGVERLKLDELKSILDAHQSAVQYAKAIAQLLLKMFDLENYKKYDLDLQKAEFDIKLFEEQLKADKARYEFINGQIEVEKLKQSVDTALVKQYESEAQALKSRTRIVQQQLEVAKQAYESKRIPIELYRNKIENFNALVGAEEANLQKMQSEIERQNTLREISLVDIKSFDTQVKAKETLFNAQQGTLEAGKTANRAKFEAYEGMSRGAALPVEYSLLRAQHVLYAHQINAETFVTDAEMALKFKQMDFEYLKRKREMRDELLRDLREISLDIAKTEIERKQAVADVAIQCSSVIASMAEGAMSAGNMVASATIEELA